MNQSLIANVTDPCVTVDSQSICYCVTFGKGQMENAFTNTALLERESFVCAERAGLWEKVKLLWVGQSQVEKSGCTIQNGGT